MIREDANGRTVLREAACCPSFQDGEDVSGERGQGGSPDGTGRDSAACRVDAVIVPFDAGVGIGAKDGSGMMSPHRVANRGGARIVNAPRDAGVVAGTCRGMIPPLWRRAVLKNADAPTLADGRSWRTHDRRESVPKKAFTDIGALACDPSIPGRHFVAEADNRDSGPGLEMTRIAFIWLETTGWPSHPVAPIPGR